MSEANLSPLVELIGHAFYYFGILKPYLSLYGHLLLSAIFPLWIGAHASLSRPSSAAKPPKKSDKNIDDDDEEDEDDQGPIEKIEGLQPSDALMFPLTAGLVLCSLYVVIEWLKNPAILNKVLGFYFSQVGIFFAVSFVKDILSVIRSFIFPKYYRHEGRTFHVKQSDRVFRAEMADEATGPQHVRYSPLPGVFSTFPLPEFVRIRLWACRSASYQRLKLRFHIRGLFDIKTLVGLVDLLSGIVALVAVGYFQFVAKPWWLTNFFGFGYSYGALQIMSPTTFGTGSLILISLFFYDIYFVFFTPVMVTVAKSLDIPIKLVFPRSDEAGVQSLAMLGLGDVVVPGMLICLALRFDLFLYYKRKGALKGQAEGLDGETKPEYQKATGLWGERFWAPVITRKEPEVQPPYHDARAFPKVYFKASIIGYLFGMVVTLLIMQYSNHAQPALLYLVPGVLLSLWGTALYRGELRLMSDFSDEEDDEEEDKEDKETGDKLADDKQDPAHDGMKGLFMRVLSGDMSVFGSKPEDKKKEKKEKKEIVAKNAEDDLDLIAFSISFPRKKHAMPGLACAEESTSNFVPAMIPGSIDDGDERPLKKRRGTPRKPTLN
ncbi:hypothetical protein N7520_002976 [Penicillium odoratum]|uniref:uncharacterized protein n=1 Tax=Penicillium odoratum TaxID=1167516 RepID=UPI0025497402|nr:uncharacterized protein N7520_002976 [Penicillium odoratum]KAJ5772447.1 hypothetical protein N7520_002976 [Penicillium odoratum]